MEFRSGLTLFTCFFTSGSPTGYQWRCNGIAAFGATGVSYIRRRAAGSTGISYHPEFSSNLTNPNGWSETGTPTVTQIDDTWERVKIIDSLVNQTKRSGRVSVTTPQG